MLLPIQTPLDFSLTLVLFKFPDVESHGRRITLALFSQSYFFHGFHASNTMVPAQKKRFVREISIGNSMICSDIWRKYHE